MSDYKIIGRTYDDLMSDPEYHQYRTNLNEVDTTPENYNVDDFGNHIYDSDWVFVGYVKLGDVKRKFVASQDGFLTALDEYDPENFLLNELEIISGKEWLGARWMEERQ